MTDDPARLITFPAEIAAEVLRLADGTVLVAEVPNTPGVIVVGYRHADKLELISRHDSQAEADAACRTIVDRLAQLNPLNIIADVGGGKPN